MEIIEHPIPPHNGIGTEEDSLLNVKCLDISQKAPNKDYYEFIDKSGKILRWNAKLNTTIPENKDRRFVISYFLHDQSMQIHEQPIRNSGIVEGKFLIRGKYKNESTGNYFHPTDF